MSDLIRFLSDFWADPLTNMEAAYIVLANIPYEEPWLYIHENFWGELEYQNKDLPVGLELEKPNFWSLSAIDTIMCYHYIKWRNAMIEKGVPRHEILRYGEQNLPTSFVEVELPRAEELPRDRVNPTPPTPYLGSRKRKRNEKNKAEAPRAKEREL